MRFFLALVVLTVHLTRWKHSNMPLDFLISFHATAAVYGFLMISGFSIRHSITNRPSGYYKRRFWRIYPTYWLCLFLALIPFLVTGNFFYHGLLRPDGDPIGAVTLINLLLIAGGVTGLFATSVTTFEPAWTLMIEELFYLLAPCVNKLKRPVFKSLVALAFACCVGSFLLTGVPYGGVHILFPAFCLFGFWLLGWRIHKGGLSRRSEVLIYLAVAVTVAFGMQNSSPGGVVLIVACAALLISQAELKIPAALQSPAQYAGNISYPMYIVHTPIFWILWTGWGIVKPEIVFTVVLSVSALIYHTVDKPLRKGIRLPNIRSVVIPAPASPD